MLVEYGQPLERAVPWRWNLAALPLVVVLVVVVTALGSRPTQGAGEPPAADSDDNVFAPPPDRSQRPATNVADLFESQPKGQRRETDEETEPPLAVEPKSEPSADPQRAAIPSQVVVDAEVEKDPIIQELTRHIAKRVVKLATANSLSPVDQEMIKGLQRQILRLEESIDERRAQLRPKILDRLAAAQDTGQSPRRSWAVSSVPPFRGRIRPGDLLKIDLAGGYPAAGPRDPATVEPDGNVLLGALYGGRINVAGATLSEAQEIIREKLQEFLKDPQVQVTYEGHNPDIAAAEASAGTRPSGRRVPAPDTDTYKRIKELAAEVKALRAANAELQHRLEKLEKTPSGTIEPSR